MTEPIGAATRAATGGGGAPSTWERFASGFERIWSHHLVTIDGSIITPGQIVIALLVALFGVFLARLVSRRLGQVWLPRFKVAQSAAQAIQSIAFYLLLALVVLLALQTAGLPLTVFTIFGGAIALGVGFGSQNVMNNFISGLIIMIERPVRIGDLVQVDGLEGVVTHIGARASLLKSYRGEIYVVPNSHLLENAVTNWHHDDRIVSSKIVVGVAYGSDTKTVEDILFQVAHDDERVLNDAPAPRVLFTEFGDNALIFELLIWTDGLNLLDRRQCESDLRFRIDALCRERDVVIAFPQRDVHVDSLSPLKVEITRES